MTNRIEPTTALGSEVLKRMYQSKMTMKALAEKLALRADTTRNLISGKGKLTLERAAALAVAFPDTTMDTWILLYQQRPFPVEPPPPTIKPERQTRKPRAVDVAGADEFGGLVVREAHDVGRSMMQLLMNCGMPYMVQARGWVRGNWQVLLSG